MAESGSDSGSNQIDWAKLATDSSTSEDEELALYIALRHSRMDWDRDSKSTRR